MALIVEDGTGLSTADAFIDEAYALAYHAAYGNTDWPGVANKEIAIRTGTQYIALQYGRRKRGYKKVETQALPWPVSGACDDDGYLIDEDSLPETLKKATAEAALRAGLGEILGDLSDPGMIASEMVKVGPVSEAITYVGGKSQVAKFRIVDLLMGPIISVGSRLSRY